ncbi:MAG: 2-oxoacid:acceptor oxidoreductase family protein [Candidatus Omnitrophota bacterium]
MKDERLMRIRICGKSGQGIVAMGNMLGYAALLQGKCVSVSASVAPAPQEGKVYCDVIMSNLPIDFPKIAEADILLALWGDAYSENIETLEKEAVVFYEPLFVKPVHTLRHHAVAAREASQKELKSTRDASLVFLSCVVRATRVISLDALTKSVRVNVSPAALPASLKGMDLGIRIAKKVKYP